MLTGGSTAEELLAAGTDVVLGPRSRSSPPGWTSTCSPPASPRSRPTCARRGSVLVAYSGGADSAFLLAAAVRAARPRPGRRRHRLLRLPAAWPSATPPATSPTSLGVEVLTPATHEMEREGYRANGGDRCFFCKAELVDVLTPLAAERGLAVVATGTNADDAVAGLPPRHPRRRRARRGRPAARRRA